MSRRLPMLIPSGAKGDNVDGVELDLGPDRNTVSSPAGGLFSALLPRPDGPSREPVDAEDDADDGPRQNYQHLPNQEKKLDYSVVPHLDPEEAEALHQPVEGPAGSYHFRRYIPRTLLNILGPLFILSFYIFIVVVYLQTPARNGIIPSRILDANAAFFAWLIIGIFVLDWAKSGIAGFEAAALMSPGWAPSDAHQLMWHADRGWGSVGSWCNALVVGVHYILKRMSNRRGTVEWQGPGILWFYLACSSLLFYITIPLSGLSMSPDYAFQLCDRPILISGRNQTTFNARVSNDIAEEIDGRWRQGNPTTPYGATVFYAPEGTPDASATYFEDTIQDIYQNRLVNGSISENNARVVFFAGPEVTERAHGKAWGFLTDLSCTPVNPYTGLELVQVKAINDWTARPALTNSRIYGTNRSTYAQAQNLLGSEAVFFELASAHGLKYQYLMAANSDVTTLEPAYEGTTSLPANGTLELVMWQSYGAEAKFEPDQTFKNMADNPVVVSSVSLFDNQTYLGYGIRCKAITNTGRARISATTNTFSSFQQEPAMLESSLPTYAVESTGVVGLHTLVYTAFTTKPLGLLGPPKCKEDTSSNCNAWVGANKATQSVPVFKSQNRVFQYPTLSPARMSLALSKLFGEAAAAVMSGGAGNWTSTPTATSDLGLYGLKPASDIVPGQVSYRVIIVLLIIWALVTIVPQLWPPFLYGRRWGDVLDGFAMFRFGAEWKNAVDAIESAEFWDSGSAALRRVPGMIGDMNPAGGGGKLQGEIDDGRGNVGFVGLSHHRAEIHGRRIYTYRSS
ncbi:hypothetical protein F4861DRAFT_505244 [Xylaria intraflava]|nr:hypothetical protein F4861DRAFT_505244 [Xylaria intraflava]